MILVLSVLFVINLYYLRSLLKSREPIRVIAVNVIIVVVSLIVGILIAVYRRPSSPAEWIQRLLQMMGVIK